MQARSEIPSAKLSQPCMILRTVLHQLSISINYNINLIGPIEPTLHCIVLNGMVTRHG